MDSLDDLRRQIGRCLCFGFRFRFGFGFIFPNLPLRLLPVLKCSNILPPQLLIEFMHSLDDLRRQIGGYLGFGLRFRFCFNFRLRFCFNFRLRFGFGFMLRLSLGFGFGLRFRVRLSLSFGIRFRLRFSFGLSFGFGLRFRLGFSFRLPNRPLRLTPVLNRVGFAAALPLV
jgi:hypothetical protein